MEQKEAVKKSTNSYLSSMEESNGILKFTLANINLSVANALRRTILSDIPTLAFKTFPHEENQADFIVNTSRINNEILKQRLSCIPIHGIQHDQPYEDLEVHIEKENTTQENIYVTTEDFKVKNIKSDKYLDDDVVKKIFPPNSITGDYIIFARLRPRISPEIPGEKLHIKAKMSIHTAGEDGAYNVTSICSYAYTPDRIKQDSVWQEYSATLTEKDPDELEIIKQDWYTLKAKRINIPNSFDFKIQTLGIFSNIDIVQKGCDLMIKRIENLKNNVEDPNTLNTMISTQATSTIPNSFDIILKNENYTLGKVEDVVGSGIKSQIVGVCPGTKFEDTTAIVADYTYKMEYSKPVQIRLPTKTTFYSLDITLRSILDGKILKDLVHSTEVVLRMYDLTK